MTVSGTALVTGRSGSIGRAITSTLARTGFDVAVAYHRDEDGAREAAVAIEEHGRQATTVQGDVSDAGEAASLVEHAAEIRVSCPTLVRDARADGGYGRYVLGNGAPGGVTAALRRSLS